MLSMGLTRASGLTAIGKWIYWLTLIPLILAGLIINMAVVRYFFPEFCAALACVATSNDETRHLKAAAGFALAAPLPIVLCWVWYRILAALGKKGWLGEAKQSEVAPPTL